ncbi:phage neck terminator protein [Providencia rettgeri]
MGITTRSQLDMKALKHAIATVLKLPEDVVIESHSHVDVSKLNHFITIGVISSELIGEENRFDAANELEIITASRSTTLSINAYGANAYQLIEKLSSVLATHYANQIFKQLVDASVLKKSEVRNLPTAIAGGQEQRAQIDLTLSHIHRIESQLNRGESVVITTFKD